MPLKDPLISPVVRGRGWGAQSPVGVAFTRPCSGVIRPGSGTLYTRRLPLIFLRVFHLRFRFSGFLKLFPRRFCLYVETLPFSGGVRSVFVNEKDPHLWDAKRRFTPIVGNLSHPRLGYGAIRRNRGNTI